MTIHFGDSSSLDSASMVVKSYAVLVDEKSQNTDGGTATSGSWQTRDLNTEVYDPDGIVSLSSNQFTLGAGQYLIEFYAPALRCGGNMARLFDVTGNSTVPYGYGMTMFADTGGDGDTSICIGFTRVNISSSNVFRIEHRVNTTESTEGFGRACNFSGVAEKYTYVRIFKEA